MFNINELMEKKEKVGEIIKQLVEDENIMSSIAIFAGSVDNIIKDEKSEDERRLFLCKGVLTLFAIHLENKKLMLIK